MGFLNAQVPESWLDSGRSDRGGLPGQPFQPAVYLPGERQVCLIPGGQPVVFSAGLWEQLAVYTLCFFLAQFGVVHWVCPMISEEAYLGMSILDHYLGVEKDLCLPALCMGLCVSASG